MPRINNSGNEPILPIVYAIDASDNMAGDKIAAINESMKETTDLFADIAVANPSIQIRIGIIKYSDDAVLLTNGFEALHEFEWESIAAGGKANLGKAISLLSELLQEDTITKNASTTNFYKPIVFFINSIGSNDDYKNALYYSNQNRIFRHALKVAVTVGDLCNMNELLDITGTPEAIITITDVDTLKFFMVCSEMPEVDYDDYPVVKPQCDKYFLTNKLGYDILLEENSTIFRCQCLSCTPERAQDALFHAELYNNTLELIRLSSTDDIEISYCIKSKEHRTIKLYNKFTFTSENSDGVNLLNQIDIEVNNNDVSFINNSNSEIYIKTTMPTHTYVSVRSGDIVCVSKCNFLTIKNLSIADPESPYQTNGDWNDESDYW